MGWLKDTVHWVTEGVKWLGAQRRCNQIRGRRRRRCRPACHLPNRGNHYRDHRGCRRPDAALALNPWALAITGVVAAGAIIYKTWSDTQANLERGYEDMRRKNIQQQMMAGKMNAEDVKKLGYSEQDVKEILFGKRLLPGEKFDDFSNLGFRVRTEDRRARQTEAEGSYQ